MHETHSTSSNLPLIIALPVYFNVVGHGTKVGTYQTAIVARQLSTPVYVAAESYKFARLFPLNQQDVPQPSNLVAVIPEDEKVSETCLPHKSGFGIEGCGGCIAYGPGCLCCTTEYQEHDAPYVVPPPPTPVVPSSCLRLSYQPSSHCFSSRWFTRSVPPSVSCQPPFVIVWG